MQCRERVRAAGRESRAPVNGSSTFPLVVGGFSGGEPADRHGEHSALGLLALCVGEAGLLAEAARLAGYCDGPLAGHRMAFMDEESQRLDAVLRTDHERQVHEAAGAAASRREILALVGHLASVLDDQHSRS